MGVQTQDLKFKILAEVVGTQAIDQFKAQIKGIGDATSSAKNTMQSLTTGLKALAGAFVIKETVQFAKSFIDLGDSMATISERTGIAVSDLTGFKAAAEKGDLPFENLVKTLQKFTANLGSVKTGNDNVINSFKALGISVTTADGSLRNSGDVIKDIADKFSKMRDGPEKARLAMELFGKSGVELIPFLNGGAEALTKFGIVMSDDFARRADQFNDTLVEIGAKSKSVFIEGLAAALPTLQEIANAFLKFGGSQDTASIFEILGEGARLLAVALHTDALVVTDFFDLLIQNTRAAGSWVKSEFGQIADYIQTVFKEGIALAKGNLTEAEAIQAGFDTRTAARMKERSDSYDQLAQGLAERQKTRAKSISEFADSLLKNSLVFGKGTLDEIRKRQQELTDPPKKKAGSIPDLSLIDKRTQDEIRSAEAFKQSSLEQIEIEKLKAQSYLYSSDELAKMTEAKKIDIEVTKATKNFTEAGKNAYLEAAEAVKAERLALIDLQEAQKQTWSVGARQAMNDYVEKAKDVAAQTRDLFNRAFANMEDALVDFVKTGKLNFQKFADDIITYIIRIQVRAALAQSIIGIGNLFGGIETTQGPIMAGGAGDAGGLTASSNLSYAAKGGIMTEFGPVPLRSYARGGIATSPQLAIFGEGARPEAYVPLPDGKSIPVSMKNSGGTNVTVNLSLDRSDDVQTDSTKGAALGRAISAAVKNEILQQSRPGGLLYS